MDLFDVEGLGQAHSLLGTFALLQALMFIRRQAPRAQAMAFGYPTWRGHSISEVGWDIRVFTATLGATAFWKFLRKRGVNNYYLLHRFVHLPLFKMDQIIAALAAMYALQLTSRRGAAAA